MWVLGIEPGFSGRAASALNYLSNFFSPMCTVFYMCFMCAPSTKSRAFCLSSRGPAVFIVRYMMPCKAYGGLLLWFLYPHPDFLGENSPPSLLSPEELGSLDLVSHYYPTPLPTATSQETGM